MTQFLSLLVLLGFVAAVAYWASQYSKVQQRQMLTAQPLDLTEQAVMVYGPERGAGSLRLTPTQLIFTTGAGRFLVIERADITGAAKSFETPEGASAKPLLVITTDRQITCCLVEDPDRWLARLT